MAAAAFRARSAASSLLIGAVLAGVAFGAAGGSQLARTTVTEILLTLVSAAVVAAAVLFSRPGPLYGGLTLVLFAAFTAVVALSITWSISPALSYVEAGRHLAYLAAFAAAVAAARLAPRATPAVLGGLLVASLAVVAYALASRVWPGTLAPDDRNNRIGLPYQYWNAVGTTAALLVPGALWLGSRQTGSAWVRALAYPAIGMAIVAIMLTQSRGALAAALVGTLLWFAIVPLRLRSLPVAVLPILGAAPVAAWALSKAAFAKTHQSLAAKESVAGEFGLLLLLICVLLLAAGYALNRGSERSGPAPRLRRRAGVAAIAAACLVPLAMLASVAFSDRSLGGTIRDRVHELTSETASSPPQGGGRFAATESTRGKYWREAARVFGARPGLGTGSGTFGVARLRYRKDDSVTGHAHGFLPQAMADTGMLGLGVSLALLAAWLAAALRTTGLLPRIGRFGPGMGRDWDAERVALMALALVPVVFGLQSAIDWTWFVPGPAVMALVAAGFVAGRGPSGAPLLPSDRLPRPDPSRIVPAVAVVVAALAFVWAIWQPEASERKIDVAVAQSDRGNEAGAAASAQEAAEANPLSSQPLLLKAAVEARGNRLPASQTDLQRAVLKFPNEPQTWLQLASFQLRDQVRPDAALETVKGALYLDPRSRLARQLFLDARAVLRARQLRAGRR